MGLIINVGGADLRSLRNRKNNRLFGYDYSQPGYYFVTICTRNRTESFGEIKNNRMNLNDYGEIAKNTWIDIPNHFSGISLDEFTIMPNHMHGIIVIVGSAVNVDGRVNVGGADLRPLHDIQPKTPLSIIIHGFKSSTTRRIRDLQRRGRIYASPTIWQRNYYDHIIRSEKSLDQIRNYIRNNIISWSCDKENKRYIKNINRSQSATGLTH
jgi:putative transposase